MTAMKHTILPLLVLATAGALNAQVLEAGFSAGASRVSKSTIYTDTSMTPPSEIKIKDGWRFGARITLNSHRFFGHEAGYNYVRASWDYVGQNVGTAAHQGFYDFLAYFTPEGSKVRPFVAGGAQFTNFMYPGYSVSSGGGGSMKFGLNYGLGVKTRVTDQWLVRLDYRQYASPKPDFFTAAPSGWLSMHEISMGVSFTL
jgi:opacity protein-like surface antigen